MAGCGLLTVSLLVISTLIHSALSEWNFTVKYSGELHSFSGCSCIEKTINGSSESINTSTSVVLVNATASLSTTARTTMNTSIASSTTTVPTSNTSVASSTTAVPTWNTTEASNYTSFKFQNCSCEKESRKCPVNATSSSENNTTVWAFNSQDSRFHECHIIQSSQSDWSDVITTQEWVDELNASNIYFTVNVSNKTTYKFLDCSTAVTDPNLESLCYRTTTQSATTTTTATTTAKSSTNTTGMIITVTIVAVNIVLAIGVCTFILCKRRQISVNIRRKEKALQELAETSNIVRPWPKRREIEDRDRTDPKTVS